MLDHGVVGVSRRKEHPSLLSDAGKLFGENTAAIPGHYDIRDHQRNVTFVSCREAKCLGCVAGVQHSVTTILEELPGKSSQGSGILNQKDGFRSPSRRTGLCLR